MAQSLLTKSCHGYASKKRTTVRTKPNFLQRQNLKFLSLKDSKQQQKQSGGRSPRRRRIIPALQELAVLWFLFSCLHQEPSPRAAAQARRTFFNDYWDDGGGLGSRHHVRRAAAVCRRGAAATATSFLHRCKVACCHKAAAAGGGIAMAPAHFEHKLVFSFNIILQDHRICSWSIHTRWSFNKTWTFVQS